MKYVGPQHREKWYPADGRHHTPGRIHTIDTVVIHATAGVDSLEWLSTSRSSTVSAHVLVSRSGEVWRIVSDDSTAHHAGFGLLRLKTLAQVNLNARSLGMELENLNDGREGYPPAQLEAAAGVLAGWFARHGYLFVCRHSDCDTRKTDPRGLDLLPLVAKACGWLG